jgi:tetratricopeptide (TPR) repeat protein
MKLNRFLVTLLSTAAIAYAASLDSASTIVLAQNRDERSPVTSVQQSNRLDKQSDSTVVARGVGIVTLFGLLATVIFYTNRRSRKAKLAATIDRFQEEFACSPVAEWYLSRIQEIPSSLTAEATAEEISSSLTDESITKEMSSSSIAEKIPSLSSDEKVISSSSHEEISSDDSSSDEISNSVSDAPSWREQYLGLIDQIIEITIKGKIRSKEQVYQMLVQNIDIGTGEIFERCFAERKNATQYKIDSIQESQRLFPAQTGELKKAQQTRVLKALQIIEGEWERWQKENRAAKAIATATQKILTAESGERFTTLLQVLDPNQTDILSLSQIQQLGKSLQHLVESSPEPEQDREIQQLASGISSGLASWQRLEGHLVSWMYEGHSSELGLGIAPKQREPWASWATQVSSPLPQQLFLTLAYNQSASSLVGQQPYADLKAWVELAILLQCVQRGLVSWFEKQPYSSKWGTASSISTFLTFAIIWCQLSNGCDRSVSSDRQQLDKACFQIMLQILRAFAQRAYFPLYGGVFALFSGEYLQDALNYLDEPLKQVEGTQEKARILTLLGYSQRILGQYERANSFHQEALEIARQADDQPCEIANLNHKSRICIAQKNYTEAINYSQRALILSRSVGDQLGEANALANLGYSEVLQAQQREEMEPTVYERAIEYLKQGFQLSERLGDSLWASFASRQSQALACNSLGIAHMALQQPQAAIEYLEKGIEAAKFSGDLYLQGLNFTYLAEAYYSLQDLEKAIYIGCIGMYLLERIACNEWRQSAGLLTILQGQLGVEAFRKLLGQHRDELIKNIGVDGYDYLPQLLEQYKCSSN